MNLEEYIEVLFQKLSERLGEKDLIPIFISGEVHPEDVYHFLSSAATKRVLYRLNTRGYDISKMVRIIHFNSTSCVYLFSKTKSSDTSLYEPKEILSIIKEESLPIREAENILNEE